MDEAKMLEIARKHRAVMPLTNKEHAEAILAAISEAVQIAVEECAKVCVEVSSKRPMPVDAWTALYCAGQIRSTQRTEGKLPPVPDFLQG